MRDHTKHIQVSKQTALEIILKHCTFTPETEVIPVSESFGRITASDVVSNWNCPNCLACRMDSVAVHWDDFEKGMPDTSNWEYGREWAFANTGVAMPEGFDTAIVVEHVIFSENDTKVAFDCMPSGRYAGTTKVGGKLEKGALLVPKGTYITPLLAAHITSGNHTQVSVIRKPRVAFLPTGNELVPACDEVPIGKNVESNSIMIQEKIKLWGGDPVIYDIVPDEPDALKQALLSAGKEADIVILNAGSSKGNDDWGIEMLEELGTVFYHQTSHGPGHHSSFGVIGNTPVIGISGPPGGAAFTTDYYVYPAIRKYLGLDPRLKTIRARLGETIIGHGMKKPVRPGKKQLHGEDRPPETGEFYTVRQLRLVQAEDGMLEAYSVGSSHPHPMEAEQADGYFLLPSWDGKKPPSIGELIEIELRPR